MGELGNGEKEKRESEARDKSKTKDHNKNGMKYWLWAKRMTSEWSGDSFVILIIFLKIFVLLYKEWKNN